MRKKGSIMLASAVPIWIGSIRFVHEVRKSPFGYEFGSIAFPTPQWFRVATIVALLLTLFGLRLILIDLAGRRKRNRISDDHH
jgi:hypothetical protein